jgi:ribonucleoside-diphosphate reductase alpha chain
MDGPYSGIQWEYRDISITRPDGSVVFEQKGVHVPSFWSLNASTILAQKYFRGVLGSPEREHSLIQVIHRVVQTITARGVVDGYLVDDEQAKVFMDELSYILVHQMASFNSPVWFNIGVEGERQQSSACFILSVDDTMESILNWYREEGLIFKGGSGSGVNLSRIRSSQELLKGGGTASGPVSFMRGADASAGTIKSGGKTRRAAKMAILDASHPDIEEFIWCKAVEEHKARALRDAGFDMGVDGKDGFSVQYQNANNSVRVTDEFMEAVLEDKNWELRAVKTGGVLRTMRARDLMRQVAQAAWECADPGLQFDTTINHWHTTPKAGRINGSNPCSEYLSLDNSSCNLASLNLLSFLRSDDSFDVESFVHVSRLVFTAQDILINHSDYPTEAIAENTRSYRQLGLGYANLGALLMTLGLPYDSDGGRALAATLTALMTGVAYKTSAELAARLEPFEGYSRDAESVLQVLYMHRDAMGKIDEKLVSLELFSSAAQIWDDTLEIARTSGVRNAQATLLAPTGTISFLMDCDTTGVEPAFSLVSYKKLVGGGNMILPVQCVESALVRLGYSEPDRQAILEAVVNGSSLASEPHLREEHRSVFATAVGENSISASGHIKMMAAVQPFLSGAISKTVNLPEETTVEEVEETYIEAWELGLKAVALYRDNCKVGQPLSSTKDVAIKDAASETETWEALAAEAEAQCSSLRHRVAELEEELSKPKVISPVRSRLPRHRRSRTYAFRVGEAEGYVTVGEYDDGRPGELFAKVSKQGSTLAGVMDAFSIAISLGLQHGVPLETYVRKFTNMRFEPAGMTDDPDLRIASSLVDYIFRRVAMDYLDSGTRSDLGIHSSDERQTMVELPYSVTTENSVGEGSLEFDAAPTDAAVRMSVANYYTTMEALGSSLKEQVSIDEHSHSRIVDAPLCYECGTSMMKTGSCWCCPGCGSSGGCS